MSSFAAHDDRFTTKDGWVVPVIDQWCFPTVIGEVAKFDPVLKRVKKFDTLIQAGGNIGIFPKLLAKYFDVVHTFEPDDVNWIAMKANLDGIKNVYAHKAGLGETFGNGTVRVVDDRNIGAHFIGYGEGDVEIMPIDSIGTKNVGLIWLDIEGAELFALKGAEKTILRDSPVIVLEFRNHPHSYGHSHDDTIKYLEELGYKAVEQLEYDTVFERQ
jgi:FkbM family methyltransferase